MLANSVFFVGPVNSGDPTPGEPSPNLGLYWFGNLPENILNIGYPNSEYYRSVSAFVGDDQGNTLDPYRIFIRRASPARGFGGTAVLQGCVFEYDSDIASYTQDDVRLVLCHEIIHNWLLMDDDSETVFRNDNGWYIEGELVLITGQILLFD